MQATLAEAGSASLTAVTEIASTTKRLVRAWAAVRKAQEGWDFTGFGKALGGFSADVERLSGWGDQRASLEAAMAELRAHTRTDAYVQEVELALREAEVPFKAISDREYEFPPFKLSLNTQEGYARLALGRKSERTTGIEPQQLARWVRTRYDRVIRSRFDGTAFKKELLAAFQIANRAKYGGTVQWGQSVELTLIYDLFTLRQAARQDYPRQLFVFDLARLRQEPDLQLDGQKFEFGFARGSDKVFSVVDGEGREARLGGLTIYERQR